MDNCASEMSFPLKHYRGISVVINLSVVVKNPPEILSDSGIEILQFKDKFCSDGNCFIMRAKDEIEHIFSELYSVPDCLQKPYFRLKVQELLLFLCMVDVSKEKRRELYTSPQVEIIKTIHKRLVSNLQERPTIDELSREYLINPTTLKDSFKGIYGQPIGSYMKEYRIKQAAILLNIDEFSSEYDLYEYRDSVNNREENVSMIYSALASGKAEPIWKWIAEIAGDENDNLPEVVEDAKKLAVRIEQAQKMGRAEIFHDPEQVDAKITFYVTECMEFPVMGEYYENLTLEEAVQKYYEIPADRINGIKGIGFRLEDGSMYDGDYELMSAGVILKESIDLVLHYKESPLVQQAIADLEQILSERQQEKNVEKPQEKQSKKEPEQAQEPLISADKEKAISVPETFPEPQKQLETIPEKDNSVPEGTGRKQSVLKALRERQAKLKQEQKHTEQKTQNYKKGEQELC